MAFFFAETCRSHRVNKEAYNNVINTPNLTHISPGRYLMRMTQRVLWSCGVPRNFFRGVGWVGGGQQIQLRTVGRENGDLGAVAPYSGVPFNLQMNETHILIRLLRMYSYIPRNWEFGSALAKLRNFGGREGVEPPKTPPLGRPLTTGFTLMTARGTHTDTLN
jgi:hypothetical protein